MRVSLVGHDPVERVPLMLSRQSHLEFRNRISARLGMKHEQRVPTRLAGNHRHSLEAVEPTSIDRLTKLASCTTASGLFSRAFVYQSRSRYQ